MMAGEIRALQYYCIVAIAAYLHHSILDKRTLILAGICHHAAELHVKYYQYNYIVQYF